MATLEVALECKLKRTPLSPNGKLGNHSPDTIGLESTNEQVTAWGFCHSTENSPCLERE